MQRECAGGPLDGDMREIPDKTADNTWFQFSHWTTVITAHGLPARHAVFHTYRYDGRDCRLVHEGPV